MGCWIVLAEIGFDLDDTAHEQLSPVASYQHLSQQVKRNQPRIAVVEAPGQWRQLVPRRCARWVGIHHDFSPEATFTHNHSVD